MKRSREFRIIFDCSHTMAAQILKQVSSRSVKTRFLLSAKFTQNNASVNAVKLYYFWEVLGETFGMFLL